MRAVKGITDLTPTDDPLYDNVNEFAAVTVTNVAIGEQNPGGLRYSHRGFSPMPPGYATNGGFMAVPEHMRLLRYLYLQDVPFFRNMALTPYINSFNPTREYFRSLR